MIGRLSGEDVRLALVAAPGLGRVEADRSQLEQVVLNLAVNARDAMPEGGSLTFELHDVELDRAQARARVGLRPGPHVVLKVSDTGIGMDAKTRERIFEPFFTTKERGKGTGLGLSTVHGIVHQSSGAIAVASEPGGGTTFEIHLPRATAPAAAPGAPPAGSPPESVRGIETILVVEDEASVRDLVTETLKAHGYTVLAAAGAAAAERVASSHRGPIHLLLTDIVMPGRSGRALAQDLLRLRPALRVLFMSGHEEQPVTPAGPPATGTAFLAKPFVPQELARRIREVLAPPSAAMRSS
jgi:CheY-like chemotaxis protein